MRWTLILLVANALGAADWRTTCTVGSNPQCRPWRMPTQSEILWEINGISNTKRLVGRGKATRQLQVWVNVNPICGHTALYDPNTGLVYSLGVGPANATPRERLTFQAFPVANYLNYRMFYKEMYLRRMGLWMSPPQYDYIIQSMNGFARLWKEEGLPPYDGWSFNCTTVIARIVYEAGVASPQDWLFSGIYPDLGPLEPAPYSFYNTLRTISTAPNGRGLLKELPLTTPARLYREISGTPMPGDREPLQDPMLGLTGDMGRCLWQVPEQAGKIFTR